LRSVQSRDRGRYRQLVVKAGTSLVHGVLVRKGQKGKGFELFFWPSGRDKMDEQVFGLFGPGGEMTGGVCSLARQSLPRLADRLAEVSLA
jgi:hypothetical protein